MRSIILTIAVLFSSISFTQNNDVPTGERFQREFLERVNKVRQQGCKCGTQNMPPVPPLTWNDMLENAAAAHAKDMYRRDYFSHESKDGRNIINRIEGAGYTRKGYKSYRVGENIAQGQLSIPEVTDGWFKSEGHCRNLMAAGFKEIGVAYYKTYWVQNFGGREAFSPEVQKLINSGKYKLIESN